MSIFDKKINADHATKLVALAAQDYWKKAIEGAPPESDLQARQDYLLRAYHEAVGIDYMAQYFQDYLKEPNVSLPSAGLMGTIKEAIEFNEEKIKS
jgi:hypothetical protein